MKMTRQMSSVIVRAMLIVALAVGLAPLAEAQTLAAKGKPAAASAKSQASANPSGGPQEGIKVHGHWTIEVRNPDGSLVSRREFENSLDNSVYHRAGASLFAILLGFRSSAGLRVEFSGSTTGGGGPCQNASGPSPCLLVGALDPIASDSNIFKNLAITRYAGGIHTVLQGTATAAFAGDISSVSTRFVLCDSTVSPAACALDPQAGGGNFTKTTLTPIPVAAGQLIQVTVDMYFS